MADSLAYNMDCMEAMKEFPDKFFDLAVVDPPYGGGAVGTDLHGAFDGRFGGKGSMFEKYRQIKANRTGAGHNHYDNRISMWDVAPTNEYFDELSRVSKEQIIWGGNYFDLPPTRCFLIWRKLNIPLEGFSMSPVEYAWTSYNNNAKMFEAFSSSTGSTERRFHPTQKPVSLYEWIYKEFAKPGFKILDTHLGSGSSRIAAYDAGLEFYGYEIDKTYFDLQEERFQRHIAQQNLFLMEGDTNW